MNTRSLPRLVYAIIAAAAATILVGASSIEPAPARAIWDGVYSDAQASRGKDAYNRECASCHLDSLGGADMAPALTGNPFLEKWTDLSIGDLYERVRISMPQDSPASLSRQQYADIVAYMLQVNRFPSGAAELGHDLDALKAIKITKAPGGR
jgi:S-disulfanyl-L-cysteine oxidoreductase SoxD